MSGESIHHGPDAPQVGRDRVLAVIPARYGASRFPGKPLASLWGKPLIQHVWERARAVAGVDALVVATDDLRIAEVALGFGAEVEMTSAACASGTDRAAEVAARRPEVDLVLNLQGDEPELDAGAVGALIAGMRAAPDIAIATLAHRETDRAVLLMEHVVKVRVDDRGEALYFTRRAPRDQAEARDVLRHIGVYGFRRAMLLRFAAWPPGEAERRERLEQLRALERGVPIRVFLAAGSWTGVDTPAQLAALERRGPGGRISARPAS
jgi:3-deoxy-manno-octulosonate cytidylyltransferase (CMP-KDO synthetase)